MDLGLIIYKKAWDLQEKYLKGIIDIKMANRHLEKKDQKKAPLSFVCEHPPVITLGRSGNMENLLFNEAFLAERGAVL